MNIKRNEKLKATLAVVVAALVRRDNVFAFASEYCDDVSPDGPDAHAHVKVSITTAKGRYELGQIVMADTNVEEMMAALDRKLAEPVDAPDDEGFRGMPASLAEALKGLLGGNVEVEVLHVDLSGVGDGLATETNDGGDTRKVRNKELAEFFVENPDALSDLLKLEDDGPGAENEGEVDNLKTDPAPAKVDEDDTDDGEDEEEPVAYTVEDAPTSTEPPSSRSVVTSVPPDFESAIAG